MRYLLAAFVAAIMVLPLSAQKKPAEPVTPPPAPDTVSPQAAKLEAELSKFKPGTPEAAATLLQLVDLYHDNGRVFGLIRAGQAFIASQPSHPKHAETMLKLLDGLVTLSRHKESIVTSRQFLERYPTHARASYPEKVLADALKVTRDRNAAGAAYETVWKRLGTTPEGKAAAIEAIHQYAAIGNVESYGKAAKVAEALFDQNPAGEYGTQTGQTAMYYWNNAQQWAKVIVVGSKLLARGLPTDKDQLRDLHFNMAQNYSRTNQHANAADSYRKALAIQDRPDFYYHLIYSLHSVNAKPAEIEAAYNAYAAKYPKAADLATVRGLVANSYIINKETARGLAILAGVLGEDARSNDYTGIYIRNNSGKPEQAAQNEQVLKAAIAKNKRDGSVLRYYLGFDVYQNQMKDKARAKQTIRELVTQSPAGDGQTDSAMSWLLSNAASDDEFKADFTATLKTRRDRLEMPAYRSYIANWFTRAAQSKETPTRVAWAKAELEKANQDPLVRDWLLATEAQDPNVAANARAALIAPNRLATLSDDQAEFMLNTHAYSLRHHNNAQLRPTSVPVYGQRAKRFATNYAAAINYVEAATDYGPPDAVRDSIAHLLKITPTTNAPDAWRRMMGALDAKKEVDLIKQVHAWIEKSQAANGVEATYATTVGDALARAELKAEANAYWKRFIDKTSPAGGEYRQCAERLLGGLKGPERTAFIQTLMKTESDYHPVYASWLAADAYEAKDYAGFEKILTDAMARFKDRPFRGNYFEIYPALNWLQTASANKDLPIAQKRKIFGLIRDMKVGLAVSAAAALADLELPAEKPMKPLDRLLAFRNAAALATDYFQDWDRIFPYAQAALGRKEHLEAATLVTALLANMPSVGEDRRKPALDVVRQSYARMGGLGLTIDESSPLAPLFQAALYLRLGDERLALETYTANKKLFDQHRNDVPVDLLTFVCESHLAAGGDENFNRVEDILRGWIVKHSEDKALDDATKAKVQLLLAKNYFKGQRYDVARNEFTTVINRYPKTPQAIDAEFGIGESFLAQKVYDQAQTVFEKLASHPDRDVVVRAEFLRGVLASRRGDRDEARAIFKNVLERVPSYDLANEVLYNLSEIYGFEQRYIDQLELLRTIGRLGRSSKRWHTPGTPLSIVVQDSDLAVSRGHTRIPVRVTTEPGGDQEVIYLRSGGAGKGLFRADLETRLGKAVKNDRILQLTGKDVIKCDYPEDFKAQFKNVPPPDAEIRIASNAKLEVSSSKIEDRTDETFAQRLEREAKEEANADKRVGVRRPANEIKPGNIIYVRVTDPDRDLGEEKDTVTLKVKATSGDEVQVKLTETGPHTGVFEGSIKTGELPAGALASDSAIGHSPLNAIDKDQKSFWMSQPDGLTPKWLAADMKELRKVDHVRLTTPDPLKRAPVRGILEGSNDGRFWFRLAANPAIPPAVPISVKYGRMGKKVFAGNFTGFTTWEQIVNLYKTAKPTDEAEVDALTWAPPREKDGKVIVTPSAIVWHGQLVQAKTGAMRISVPGNANALVIDGRFELPVGNTGPRTADVWLESGAHEMVVFAAGLGDQELAVTRMRADHNAREVLLTPFVASDFDLKQPAAEKAAEIKKAPIVTTTEPGVWDFQFAPMELRYVRLNVLEYRGDAVAISNFEVGNTEEKKTYIPTEADVLAMASNDTLEIAPGDTISVNYTDEFTETPTGAARLLTSELTATYYNATATAISYDFDKDSGGAVLTQRKLLARIEPGDRIIVEITDYDEDRSEKVDEIPIQVLVNDGKPLDLIARETGEHTGIFTKEVDTSAKAEEGKIMVKPGDRVVLRYMDKQNTFPGHGVYREAIVYVNTPSEGKVRIFATRAIPAPPETKAPPTILYLPEDKKAKPDDPVAVTLEAPLTVEVIDRDAAKDSRSSVIVTLTTTDGAKVDVECVVSNAFAPSGLLDQSVALEEGRFIGQVIMQLGGKASQSVVPLTANMPRNLVGGPKVVGDKAGTEKTVVTTVLNVTGKDLITATYNDALRPDGKATKLTAKARIAVNGSLLATDAEYKKPLTQLHVGERLYLMVNDPDLDKTDERDTAKVLITTDRGEKETVELVETLAHSGIFTGSVLLKATDKPTPGNYVPENPAIECYFGDTLVLKYIDSMAATDTGTLEIELKIPVVIGTDGLVTVFSKTFTDEKLAVETQFHIAESYFELFKSHRTLKRDAEERSDLEAGRRVLREVMEDYPNPKYVPRIAYLLGQFSQELRQWPEAIESYQMIVRQYPDHTLAADAQYKLAQCYEEAGDFDQALEAYVTLAATYPKSPLIANVMVRICEYFYKKENFKVAAQVGEKFLERFEGHKWAPKMAFRVGQCHFKNKDYVKAGDAFDRFAKNFHEDLLAADSMFWSGESFRMGNNMKQAFVRYNKCRWDFPASEAAKYARGRLALPEMLQQFEAAADLDNK